MRVVDGRKAMELYYDNICLGYILTDRGMSVEEMMDMLEIDMDAFAEERDCDDWDYGLLSVKRV